MKVVFMATGDIALPAFRHLVAEGPRPVALVTQPDKAVGRHQQTLQPPAIKTVAIAAGIPVFQPERVESIAAELAAFEPDVIVVMAYGQILRKKVIALPRTAIINVHASLLPKYRGASCIQAAIDAGDAESGVTIMHVIRQLDAGDIILKRALPLAPEETGGSLHDRLAEEAPAALADALRQLADGTATRTPQDDATASYAPKLHRDDGKLDWSQSAGSIERRVRAYDPWPGTFSMADEAGHERRLKIFPPLRVVNAGLAPGEVSAESGRLVVGCGSGAVEIAEVQPEGGRRMPAADYLRGKAPRRLM